MKVLQCSLSGNVILKWSSVRKISDNLNISIDEFHRVYENGQDEF